MKNQEHFWIPEMVLSLGVKHLGGSPFIAILPVGFTKAWETAWMSSE